MARHTVTLIPGDGIGVETSAAMQRLVVRKSIGKSPRLARIASKPRARRSLIPPLRLSSATKSPSRGQSRLPLVLVFVA